MVLGRSDFSLADSGLSIPLLLLLVVFDVGGRCDPDTGGFPLILMLAFVLASEVGGVEVGVEVKWFLGEGLGDDGWEEDGVEFSVVAVSRMEGPVEDD